jgi:uncharacterized protein with von Willebrand factor type A (vWA) domain
MSWTGRLDGSEGSPCAIQTDRYDRKTWGRLQEESSRVRQHAEASDVAGLQEDVWASLYKAAPTVNPQGSWVNRRVMEDLMQTPSWSELRRNTQFDEYAAAMGMLDLPVALPQDVQDVARQVQQQEEELERLLEQAREESDAGTGNAEERARQVEQARAALDAAGQAFEASYDAQAGAIRKGMRMATQRANEEQKEREQAFRAFGMGPGEMRSVPGEVRMQLAERLKGMKLRNIAQLVGRMKPIALRKRRQRAVHPPSEVTSVTTGADVARLLPSELGLLADPETEDLFWVRFAEKRLLQHELHGYEKVGQGPIIVCIDESGSTQNGVEAWEKAVALSLFAIAKRERRGFAAIHFSAKDTPCIVQKWTNAAKATGEDMIKMAEQFVGGGTDFEKPLSIAVSLLQENGFAKGDIVLLTDGEAPVADNFCLFLQKKKSQFQAQIISVLIGGALHSSVERFSDHVVRLEKTEAGDIDLIVGSLQ